MQNTTSLFPSFFFLHVKRVFCRFEEFLDIRCTQQNKHDNSRYFSHTATRGSYLLFVSKVLEVDFIISEYVFNESMLENSDRCLS